MPGMLGTVFGFAVVQIMGGSQHVFELVDLDQKVKLGGQSRRLVVLPRHRGFSCAKIFYKVLNPRGKWLLCAT